MELELQKEFQIEENRMEKALSLKEHGEFEVVLAWLKYKLWGKGNSWDSRQKQDHPGPFPTPGRADGVADGKGERKE